MWSTHYQKDNINSSNFLINHCVHFIAAFITFYYRQEHIRLNNTYDNNYYRVKERRGKAVCFGYEKFKYKKILKVKVIDTHNKK